MTSTVLSSQGIIQEAPIGIGDVRMRGGVASCLVARHPVGCRFGGMLRSVGNYDSDSHYYWQVMGEIWKSKCNAGAASERNGSHCH